MYKSLFKRFKEQDSKEVFAHFRYRADQCETWETPFEKLAGKAKREDWNFSQSEFKKDGINFPILTNYLNYTFLRHQKQKTVKFSTDNERACFNTGLQTPEGKDIYITFFKNRNTEELDQPAWVLYGFFDTYSEKLRDFEPLPDIAVYIKDPADLVIDLGYQLEVNYAHIVKEHKERLPYVLQENETLAINAIEGAVKQLQHRIKRNYKLAIPSWYEEKIQLLLPLSITDDQNADVALVADKDKERKKYFIRTVLAIDQAYVDARLITAPDRDWLNP